MIEGPFKPLSEAHGEHLYDIKKIRHIVDQIETFIANMPIERQKIEIRRIANRSDELTKAFEPFGAQMDFLANTEKPVTHLDYLAKLNLGFEAFIYYLEDLGADFGLDIPELMEDNQAETKTNTSRKMRRPFSSYFLRGGEDLPELIKKEFPGIRGVELRLVLEVLIKHKYFSIGHRERQAIYEAMTLFFDHDIAAKSAIFDNGFDEQDFKAVENKFRDLIKMD